jgi:hypothetical protein
MGEEVLVPCLDVIRLDKALQQIHRDRVWDGKASQCPIGPDAGGEVKWLSYFGSTRAALILLGPIFFQ